MSAVSWCCTVFKANYERGGERGVAVLYAWREDELQFFLQFRALEPGIDPFPVPVETPVSLVTQVPISFCPWCGAHLLKRYRKQVQNLPIRVAAI
jgi:hypothetical protein